ncbi:hypothetical protein WJX75_001474 [Coccomyxa subellipsoidea]|uniref:Uncharacterized protein n=1 Tax=Coccomyxa subellipsoidea TaxID=248742 RepID=A0ABR2YEL2_9CHLO
MDGQEASGVTGKEELVSSWQDLRGRNLLTGEHRWESIAGGRHADVVPLDGGMEAFSGLSCIKTDDHQAVGFMTVCKGGIAEGMEGSPDVAIPQQKYEAACESLPESPKSTHEQVCFDDEEAELLPATKPMQFEGADCVHPSRPQEDVEAVPDLDEDNDAEHEASSLAGSDHEYAFVFEKPLSSLEVESPMQEAPKKGSRRPARAGPEASRQAPLPPTPMSTPQETVQAPSPPPPPAAELAEVRQRSLDESGVIPGGRAAFGAPAPALQPRPAAPGRGTAAAAPLPRAADGRGAVPGGRAAFGAPLPTAGAAATSASGWRPGGAERPTGAAAAIGRAPGGSPVRLLPQLHAQTAVRRMAPADSRAFQRLVLRRLEAGAMPGDMLDCFDRLWHGSSVVESQS